MLPDQLVAIEYGMPWSGDGIAEITEVNATSSIVEAENCMFAAEMRCEVGGDRCDLKLAEMLSCYLK